MLYSDKKKNHVTYIADFGFHPFWSTIDTNFSFQHLAKNSNFCRCASLDFFWCKLYLSVNTLVMKIVTWHMLWILKFIMFIGCIPLILVVSKIAPTYLTPCSCFIATFPQFTWVALYTVPKPPWPRTFPHLMSLFSTIVRQTPGVAAILMCPV